MLTAVVGVGVLTAAWAAAAAPARATFSSRTAADEPQYLLTALSLWEDGDLDIADELASEDWRHFHEAALPEQTRSLENGRRLSPHNALLPVLLAVPVGLGGWLGAKLSLAATAGVLAGMLVWVAIRRLGVRPALAALSVLAFSLTAPLVVYGAQVYPELPAALAVTIGIAALTGPLGGRGLVGLASAVVALPWLSVKYAPVAAALAAIGLVALVGRGDRRRAVALAGSLAVAGIAYLAFHRAVYGGWTPYAAGDHFVGGELTVAGTTPNYGGRSIRLLGLLTDRVFGLLAWAPAWLLAVPAAAALVRRRPPGWAAMWVPAAAGWLVATFVALTMHGFWWPGRQVVVILPALVLATAWWLGETSRSRPRTPVVAMAAAATVGLITWAWLLVEVLQRRASVIFAFETTRNPFYRLWQDLLPDYRRLAVDDWALHGAWVVAVGMLAIVGWRSMAAASAVPQKRSKNPTIEEKSDDDRAVSTTSRRTGPGLGVRRVGVR